MNPSISRTSVRAKVLALLCVCACACVVALAGCGSSQPISTTAPGPVAGSSADATDEYRETALLFAEGWYGDWSFEDGEMQLATSNPAGRCVGYVEAGTVFDQEMQELSSTRDSARCPVEISVKNAEGDTIQLEVEYVSTQNTGIDEAMYEEMQRHSSTDDLILTFNESGRITHVDGLS